MNGSIYALLDPITNVIRYIGQTRGTIENRKELHWRDRNQKKNINNHKANWIRKLYRENKLKPNVILIEKLIDTSDEVLNNREKYWIEFYRKEGIDLTNTSGNDYFKSNRSNLNKYCKKIYCYSIDFKLIIYKSAREASFKTGVSYKTISENAKGKYRNLKNVFSFVPLTEEEIILKFKNKNKVNIPVKSVDKFTNEEIIFKNQVEGSKHFNCNFRNINLVLKGKRNYCANQKWEYIN